MIQTAWFLTTATLRRLTSEQEQELAEVGGRSESAAVEAANSGASEAARTDAAGQQQGGIVALSACEEIFRRLQAMELACGGCGRYRDECALLLLGWCRTV